MKQISFLLISIFLISGCATTPTALPIKDGMLDDFSTSNSIYLVNTANTPELKKWTNSLITFLSKQLVSHGAKITPDSSRKLEIEIIDTYQNGVYAYWAYKCQLTIRVKTEDGYVNEFDIKDISGLSLQRACNFCVTKTVANILNDSKIREYLGIST
jgi:uncharacterized lipoprotein YajG